MTASPEVHWEDRTLRIDLNPDDDWNEIVFTGRATVTLLSGCPRCNGRDDHIVGVVVDWDDEALIAPHEHYREEQDA